MILMIILLQFVLAEKERLYILSLPRPGCIPLARRLIGLVLLFAEILNSSLNIYFAVIVHQIDFRIYDHVNNKYQNVIEF